MFPEESSIEGLSLLPVGRPIPNIFSVDVEDWQQSVYDNTRPVSDRFLTGLNRILTLLDSKKIKATFFVLGNIAEHSPEVVRQLALSGHDVQTHGFDHTEVTCHTPTSFRQDVKRSKSIIENITGKRVVGFRAPRFSINSRTAWALDILAEEGFLWDSSIFPMKIRGYGINGWPTNPVYIQTRSGRQLLEIPITVGSVGRFRIPIGGGGYFRLLPGFFLESCLSRIARSRRSLMLYCHPHEFDPDGLNHSGLSLSLYQKLHQGTGRKSFDKKVKRLLSRFTFSTLSSTRAISDQTPEGISINTYSMERGSGPS